jgi:hypothetical protein
MTWFPASIPKVRLESPVVLLESARPTDRNVAFPGGAAKERLPPDSCVVVPYDVIRERIATDGRVATTSRIANKSFMPNSCVVVAYGVAKQCKRSICGVAEAACVAQKRSSTSSNISVRGVEHKRSSANTGVQLAGRNAFERKPTNCRVETTCGKAQKGFLAFCGVAVRITAIRRRADRLNVCQRTQRRAGKLW